AVRCSTGGVVWNRRNANAARRWSLAAGWRPEWHGPARDRVDLRCVHRVDDRAAAIARLARLAHGDDAAGGWRAACRRGGGRRAGGATAVSVDAGCPRRLSRGVREATFGDGHVTLSGPDGAVAARVVAAEDGRLVLVWPLNSLAPATTYTLTLTDINDWAGV